MADKDVQVMFRTTAENKKKIKTLAAIRSQSLENMIMDMIERELKEEEWLSVANEAEGF